MVLGRDRPISAVHPLKEAAPRDVMPLGRFTEVSFVQFAKAAAPIVVAPDTETD